MKKLFMVFLIGVVLTSCGAGRVEGSNKIEQGKEKKVESKDILVKEKNINSPKNVNKKSLSGISKYTICIDAGHQEKPMLDKEPYAPNSSKKKYKVSGGATGTVTKKPEYKLTLEIALLLQKDLKSKGYNVVMTRESNNSHLSNIDRANIGNNAKADLVVRIHADSNDSPSISGSSILYPSGQYTKKIQKESYRAAKIIEKTYKDHTGAKSRGVIPRDDMTGFNWSRVPTIIVEMGFLSNPKEDRLMSERDYQKKILKGLSSGIEEYSKLLNK